MYNPREHVSREEGRRRRSALKLKPSPELTQPGGAALPAPEPATAGFFAPHAYGAQPPDDWWGWSASGGDALTASALFALPPRNEDPPQRERGATPPAAASSPLNLMVHHSMEREGATAVPPGSSRLEGSGGGESGGHTLFGSSSPSDVVAAGETLADIHTAARTAASAAAAAGVEPPHWAARMLISTATGLCSVNALNATMLSSAGLAGATSGPLASPFVWSYSTAGLGCATATGDVLPIGPSALGRSKLLLVQLDMNATLPMGAIVSVNTCASTPVTLDTYLYVGLGCPASWTPFGCALAADDGCGAPGSSNKLSSVTGVVLPNASRYVYAYVSLPVANVSTVNNSIVTGAGFNLRVSWSAFIPSATATSSASSSASGSSSASSSATPTPAPYCFSAVSFNRRVNGTSAQFTGNTADGHSFTSAANPWPDACDDTGDTYPNTGLSHMIALDLGGSTPLGGSLFLDTCNTNNDTQLWVGSGCPSLESNYNCFASDGDDPTGTCATSTDSWLEYDGVTTRLLYLMVGAKNGGPVAYHLNFTYVPPSATPSATPSSTRTGSVTPSYTPTSTHTYGVSGSSTATGSSTMAPSVSSSTTPSRTGTASGTGSITPTPSGTPSHTPSSSRAPYCFQTVAFNAWLNGTSGSYTGSTVTGFWAGESASFVGAQCTDTCWYDPDYVGGSCGNGPYPTNYTVPPGHSALIALDLGPTAVLGGYLEMDTCVNPYFDTLLFVGTGCPTSYGSFNCLGSNDDAGDVCAGARQSAVMLPVSTRLLYVLVGGFSAAAAPYTLSWTYTGPTASPSNAATRSTSRTASVTLGASPSVTPTFSSAKSSTATPTATNTGTGSFQGTPVATPSNSASPGSCGAGPSAVALAGSLTGTAGWFFGSTVGQTMTYPYGRCLKQLDDGVGGGGGSSG